MATKKAAKKATSPTATSKTTTETSRSGQPAVINKPAARRKPAKTEEHASREVSVAAHKVAAEQALVDRSTGAFNDEVGSQQSRIKQALAEREAKVREMDKEATTARDEEENVQHTFRAPQRVPDVENGVTSDAIATPPQQVGGSGPRVPGTGVADPEDLAPGQSLEPSPPGGVTIAPLPDKPGSNFSKLK